MNQGSRLNGARRYKLRHNDDPSQKYGKKQQQHMEHQWNLVMRGNNGRWRNILRTTDTGKHNCDIS